MRALNRQAQYALTLFGAVIIALFTAEGSLRSKPPEKPKPTISVESFETEDVIGYLGHPLGTVVRVTGVAFDGDTLNYKLAEGKTFLKIETVNGKKLDKYIDFEFEYFDRKIEKPLPKQRFDYYVHEDGSFNGTVNLPREISENVIGIAGPRFHYARSLMIHRSQPVK